MAGVPHADDGAMDETRSSRGLIGAALSFAALGLAIGSLLGPHGRPCPTADRVVSLDLSPLFLLAVAAVAVALDVRAWRRGDRLWARVGLAAVSAAAALGIWAAAAGFFEPGCG
jgi:hypothetical protein